VPITIGLPFRPDVQFAPIYVAQALGEFASRGLDVSLEYGSETDFLQRVARGDLPAAIVGGDQVLLARAQDIPVVYVATWYHRFPVAVFSLDPTLDTAAGLAGRSVGEPMPGGVTSMGLRALLAAAGVAETDVSMEVIGFNQVEAIRGGRVDAAVGYAVNEPLRLRSEGLDVTVIGLRQPGGQRAGRSRGHHPRLERYRPGHG
jgi:NitT/TauT family transport system substrate-binding protein